MMKTSMIARNLYALADLLEIREAHSDKADAARAAAQLLDGMELNREAPLDIATLDIAEWIKEMLYTWIHTGEAAELVHLQSEVPLEVQQMLRFPRLTAKQIGYLYRRLGIDSLAKLDAAAKKQRLRKIPGFGAKVELQITKSMKQMQATPEALPIAFAYPIAQQLLERLRRYPEVQRAALVGGLRRYEETVEKVELVVATHQYAAVQERIIHLPNLTQVTMKDEGKVLVRLQYLWEVIVEIHITTAEAFESTLQHIPAEIRDTIRVNEWGAEHSEVPRLIEVSDLQGDLHMHTNWSDGGNSIEEMARAALERGYRYIAITDHSRSLKIAGGLSIERLLQQKEEIKKIERKLQQELADFAILCGIEMDILADGTPDYPDELLQEMDIVIASIHTNFNQDEYTITKRLIEAVLHRHVDFIAHPTGRIIAKRDAYPVNMEVLFKAAKETGTALELNSNPERLDLMAEHIHEAIYTYDIPITINTDAHAVEELDNIHYGIGTAQRGLAKPEHVINTWPLEQLREYLRRND